jgi:Tfp pilus assembly protein PilX
MLKRLEDESGIALVMALLTMFVLTIASSTVIFYATSSQHSSKLSLTRDSAYRLAESGINNALSILGQPPDPATLIGNNAMDKDIFCGLAGATYVTGTPATVCTLKNTYTSGYVIWSGILNPPTALTPATWVITSTGYALNTNVHSTSTYSTRQLTVSVAVHPTLTQRLNTPVWNYIYATKPASAPGICDEDLFNSVQVASPFYVEGNLCLHQTSSIAKGIYGSSLVVKGRLSMDSQQQNYAGTSAAPLSDAHIGNGCTVKNATHTPCQNNGSDNLYALVLDNTPPQNLAPPVPAYDNWYLNASPGPYFPCQTMNGLAPLSPPTFDNQIAAGSGATDAQKLVYSYSPNNNSVAPQDLTPGYDYRCQTAAGELSWSNATKTLTIKGTIYIDGSVYIQNGAVNKYTGQGVIYLGGTLLIKNSSLCGAINAGVCDLRTYQASPAQGWNPNANLLCFVARGIGDSQVSPGDSAQLISGTLQGAVYAAGNIDLVTTSVIDGPMVGYQVLLGQSVSTSFPSITIVPESMPGNPTAYAQIDPPSGWSG